MLEDGVLPCVTAFDVETPDAYYEAVAFPDLPRGSEVTEAALAAEMRAGRFVAGRRGDEPGVVVPESPYGVALGNEGRRRA
jgi:hypothetical protein